MRNTRWATVLTLALVTLLMAASCSNSKAKVVASSTTSGGDGGAAPTGTAAPGTHVNVVAPGVTNTEIRVGGVASITNPLGGKYGDAFAGTKAYFDMINKAGGIYGRKLQLVAQRDDKLADDKLEIQGLLTQDHVFAVMPVAVLLFTGAQVLVNQAIPTFGWTINPEWEGTKEAPKANLFGQTGSFLCFDCAAPALPWLMGQAKAHTVGVLAYSVPQSADCAQGVENTIKK
jgi:hypothetical protein